MVWAVGRKTHPERFFLFLWLASALLAGMSPEAISAQSSASVQATTVAASAPSAVAYDAAGNLYIAVANDHVVRKVDTLGFITTVAGTGEQGYSGDSGSATAAQLDTPSGVAVDASGNLYIADTRNHRVRRVSSGTITTFAGTGAPGYAGDSGSATAAQLNAPTSLSLDASGNLYIADTANNVIRKVTGSIITTVAGTGEQGYGGDNGPATAALLDMPTGVAVDGSVAGRFYIADRHNNRLRMVDVTGNISTLAGTGAIAFSGDGGAPSAATLADPRGVASDALGNVYVADAGNQRIRRLYASNISTVAGIGEQGFAGDVGNAVSAALDTPQALAVSGSTLALASPHNGRVRSIASSRINTVAGTAPPLTEGLSLSGPTTGAFGSSPGSLTTVLSNHGNTGTGSVTLYRDGASIATQALASNSASFSLAGTPGGLHSFATVFGGDTTNGPATSGVFLVNILAANQTITFPSLTTPVTYRSGLTATLVATASSGLPVTYTATGPATVSGSTLTYTGAGTVTVTAAQAGNSDYAPVSASQTITVNAPPFPTVGALSPNTAPLGTSSQAVIITGTNFSAASVVVFRGAAIPTTYISATQLNAVLPQLLTLGAQPVTVYDSSTTVTSNAVQFTVTAPSASAQLTAPATSTSGQQPTITFRLGAVYPVDITGSLNLSFVPDGSIGVNDPNIQFSSGGRSLNFNIAANTVNGPTFAVQTGTVAGVITLTLTLTAQGTDVTPTASRVTTIIIPRQAPVITSLSFTQAGSTLTVVTRGYSNTRDMSSADFKFTAAPGSTLSTTALNLNASSIFSAWFNDSASVAGGSIFTYTQTFNLSDSGTVVQSVGAQLTNATGASTATEYP